MKQQPLFVLLLLATACTREPDPSRSPQQETSLPAAVSAPPVSAPTTVPANGSASVVPPAPAEPVGLSDHRTPRAEPNEAIDPKSADGAGQVVQDYGALLEARRFGEARLLWSDAGRASGKADPEFASDYSDISDLHTQVGKPFDMEGAAGSSYIQVPFQLSGRTANGQLVKQVGSLTLRRVNDVPGATPAQLRWHISGAELKQTP